MNESTPPHYRIKTDRGYYFTESNGRYARFYGNQSKGEILCSSHADEIIRQMKRIVPELQMEREDFPGNAPCAVCHRLKQL